MRLASARSFGPLAIGLALVACGRAAPAVTPCEPGARVVCACPGGGEGKRICAEGGVLGGCECLADREIEEPPRASPTAYASIAAEPTPSAPAREPDGADRDARIHEWLSSRRLRGHDNAVAAFRSVHVRRWGDAFTIDIANQFGFHCQLEFDERGSPAALRDCRSRAYAEWIARPDRIALTCTTRERDELCEGAYQLGTTDGYRNRAVLQIVRPLAAPPSGASPPVER
jgi:hypothetical protein